MGQRASAEDQGYEGRSDWPVKVGFVSDGDFEYIVVAKCDVMRQFESEETSLCWEPKKKAPGEWGSLGSTCVNGMASVRLIVWELDAAEKHVWSVRGFAEGPRYVYVGALSSGEAEATLRRAEDEAWQLAQTQKPSCQDPASLSV